MHVTVTGTGSTDLDGEECEAQQRNAGIQPERPVCSDVFAQVQEREGNQQVADPVHRRRGRNARGTVDSEAATMSHLKRKEKKGVSMG